MLRERSRRYRTENTEKVKYILKVYTFVKSAIMKTLSLKLDDDVFEETDRIAGKLNIARNRYINEALEAYNLLISRKLLKEKLLRESNQVSKTSMEVLKELERITDDL